jgi:hypothetical protein
LYAISVGMQFLACNSSGLQRTGSTDGSSSSDSGTGGSSGTETDGAGGTIKTGGITSSGGVTSTGGINNSGGVTSTGGVASSGGIAESGGVTNAGGVAGTGGVTSSGGVTNSGGVNNSGGVTGSGGVTATGGAPTGHFQMENLDRGVVAVVVAGGVYVGWHMFGYEYDATASNVSYNLYRDGTKIATVTDSTNFLDAAGLATSKYTVTAVIRGTEGPQSPAITPWAQNYLSIPLSIPPAGLNGGTYSANDASTGDLDGDGQLDIVLKWDPSNSKDSASTGVTDSCIIDGIKLDGTRLWRIDVGQNIRAGAHDTQFSVYDFDGDGKAEVAFKTAPGTKDGNGNFLSNGPAAGADNTKDYRGPNGIALGGPEWLTVFSGQTGEELATVEYPVLFGSSDWGDPVDANGVPSGNRSHRYNGGVSFVSDTGRGKAATGRPSIIQQRGYYTRLTVSALNWREGALTKLWTYDSGAAPGHEAYGKGNHSLMTADVDNDGAMELIPGASTINSDGTFRCGTSNSHGDALQVGPLVKGQGIHVFMPHETEGGYDCHSADTCEFTFNVLGGGDNIRGVADWVSPSNSSSASCTSGAVSVYCADGSPGAPSAGSAYLIYWDADEWRELCSGTSIVKSSGGTLLTAPGTSTTSGTRSTPILTADLLGDWREELVLHESNSTGLRVYTTTDVTARRIYTLMHDPTYRMQVTFEQSGYNQSPHVGFHIGANMADPPKPDIYVR